MPNQIARQELISHIYNGFNFEQRASDGYYDATQMCAIFQKRFNNYYRTKGTKKFLASLSRSTLKSVDSLVEIKLDGKNEERGVFVHPLVANHLAFTLDSDFAVFVSFLIEAGKQGHLEYRPKAIKPERTPEYLQIRQSGKETRRNLTDFLILECGKTSVHAINITNQIYRGLFGGDAKAIKALRGLPEKANVREHLHFKELYWVDMMEQKAIELLEQEKNKGGTISSGAVGRTIKALATSLKEWIVGFKNATALLT